MWECFQECVHAAMCHGQMECAESTIDCLQPGAQQQKRPMFGGLGSSSRQYADIQVDLSQVNGDGEHYMETDENRAFRQEFEQHKVAQDDDLEFIEKGLGNLQNIAQDMGAEINKQDVLIDEIETGVRSLFVYHLYAMSWLSKGDALLHERSCLQLIWKSWD